MIPIYRCGFRPRVTVPASRLPSSSVNTNNDFPLKAGRNGAEHWNLSYRKGEFISLFNREQLSMRVVGTLAGMLVCVSASAQTSKMAFVGFAPTGGGLFTIDLESALDPALITNGLEAFDGEGINPIEFDWSPDGKEIAFVHVDQMGPTDIYLVNSDGTNLREVVRQARFGPGYGRNPDSVAVGSGANYWPVWSPDGVAYCVYRWHHSYRKH